ncbi:hypothetical protein OF83DRAFT_1055364 [Amylostereum chailletii]|nr:hypothetical protein OF83DRAFT_1055364 [Amylostereum chailletii]
MAEADVKAKIETAQQKKQTADDAFKQGDLKSALRSYHESLLYIQGIDKNALNTALGAPTATPEPGVPPAKTEADEMIEKIYANMSACHIKLGNWQRALDTANKACRTLSPPSIPSPELTSPIVQAIDKNEKNYKALFRKAKALGELGYFERAERILEDLARKSSTAHAADAAAANAELTRLRAIDKERERKHNQKLKGAFDRPLLSPLDADRPSLVARNNRLAQPGEEDGRDVKRTGARRLECVRH